MNKSAVVVLTVLSFCATITSGQNSKFEIGLEGGPGFRSLRGNKMIENAFSRAIGYSGGMAFQYHFTERISIRTNIAYERKGAITDIKYTDEIGNTIGFSGAKVNFDYLSMPVLTRLAFGKKIKFFVNAGPYFGYLIRQTFVQQDITGAPPGAPVSDPSVLVTNNTDNFKRIDMGLTSGAGAGIPVKSNLLLTLELRNNLGLYDVSKVPVYTNGSILTNSTNLLIGIAYRPGNGDKK